jgi:hypothetical protein
MLCCALEFEFIQENEGGAAFMWFSELQDYAGGMFGIAG